MYVYSQLNNVVGNFAIKGLKQHVVLRGFFPLWSKSEFSVFLSSDVLIFEKCLRKYNNEKLMVFLNLRGNIP